MRFFKSDTREKAEVSQKSSSGELLAGMLSVAITGSGTPHINFLKKAEFPEVRIKAAKVLPPVCTAKRNPKTTLFVGDSLTVALSAPGESFLEIDGQMIPIAKVSMRTDWGLKQAKKFVSKHGDSLEDIENAVVLFGTNDIAMDGPDWTAEKIHERLEEIYQILSDVRQVYAVTIPPFKGYKPFKKQFKFLNDRRLRINELIRGSETPDHVIDLAKKEKDGGVADNNDPDKLKEGASYGDKLHIRKEVLTKAYMKALEKTEIVECKQKAL